MDNNLTNAELITQIAKNNPVWSDEKAGSYCDLTANSHIIEM